METCLRNFTLVSDPDFSPADPSSWLRGIASYSLLLRIACGLESEIKGEPDVFGQIKEAWRAGKGLDSEQKKRLQPWFQNLFEDAKEIRSAHLQSMGGSSYASFVRKIAGTGGNEKPVLLAGAGSLAESVAARLGSFQLFLLNRGKDRLLDLSRRLQLKHPGHFIQPLMNRSEEAAAIRNAGTLVYCVPQDPQTDEFKVKEILSLTRRPEVIHFGLANRNQKPWDAISKIWTLEEIFNFQKNRSARETEQLALAAKSCDEKAKLRSLGSHTTHGWEDLVSAYPV